MYNILTLNAISDKINTVFADTYTVGADVNEPEAILVRSASMHDYEIPEQLLAVARAGAGVNNIPIKEMSDMGVCVFNTPGANANAVKELVLCGTLLASRGICEGISWASTLNGAEQDVPKAVEKGKKAYGGCEILGKTMGVVGLGAIGLKVALACKALGMNVIGYDPFVSPIAESTLADAGIPVVALQDVYKNSNYITLHVPLLNTTRGMINADALAMAQDGLTVLNFSRAELVDVVAIKEAIASGKVNKYVVDFPTADVIGCKGIIAIPHLGASTEEAEDNCAIMASEQLVDYLENGNIKNSVNFPAISVPRTKAYRMTAIYDVSETASTAIKAVASKLNIDVAIAERGEIGYAIFDTDDGEKMSIESDNTLWEEMDAIDEVNTLRII